MKFVSKKDMLFISGIFLVVIIFSLFSTTNAVEVSFGEEVMSINASGFDFDIAYVDVEKIELSQVPDLGTMDKGTDAAALKCGNWNNAIWGAYHLCIVPENTSCVVVSLKDGRTVVFNYKEAENTADIFEIFQTNLEKIDG